MGVNLLALASATVTSFTVVGDGIPAPLTATAGDPARGAAIARDRQAGLCLLCHAVPGLPARETGTLAGDLAGAGSRWSAAQLRLRLVDPKRIDPASTMPAFHRVDGLVQVGQRHAGRPVLQAQEIEDLVAWLQTLR